MIDVETLTNDAENQRQPSIAHIRGETEVKFRNEFEYGNGTANDIARRQSVKGITKRYLTIDPNDDTGTRIWYETMFYLTYVLLITGV